MNKMWSTRVSIIIVMNNLSYYWPNFNDLNNGTKYTLSKFKDEITNCYPEEPRQAEEMGWQDPEAVQQRQCKVLHLGRMGWGWLASRHLCTKRRGDPGGQRKSWVSSVSLLWCTLSCTNKSVASKLAGKIISIFNTCASGSRIQFWACYCKKDVE